MQLWYVCACGTSEHERQTQRVSFGRLLITSIYRWPFVVGGIGLTVLRRLKEIYHQSSYGTFLFACVCHDGMERDLASTMLSPLLMFKLFIVPG